MHWIKNILTVSFIAAMFTGCFKKDKEKPVVFIQPALLDTIFSSTYEGTIPCPDCPGIETSIRIYNDSTISRTIYYQERKELPITKVGTWKLKDSIFEATFDREKLFYKIKGIDKILRVGSDLKEVTGDMASQYVLHKAVPFKFRNITGSYYAGDTLNLYNRITVEHTVKEHFNVQLTHYNKLDSVTNCTTKLEAILDKGHQLNIPLNKDKGNLKIIFTKKEAHVLFENIAADSAFFKCEDSLRTLPVTGSYKKIQSTH